MKTSCFLMAIMIPFLSFAQTGGIVFDSMFLSKHAYSTTTSTGSAPANTFRKSTIIAYDNLDTAFSSQNIGYTYQAEKSLFQEQLDKIRAHAHHMANAMKEKYVMKEWFQYDKEMQRVGLKSLSKMIQDTYESDFIGDAEVKESGGIWIQANIIKNQQGNIRLLYQNKGYTITIMADSMIRLSNWPTAGENIALYELKENLFSSFDREVAIRIKNNQ